MLLGQVEYKDPYCIDTGCVVSMGAGAAGQFKLVIIPEMPDVFLSRYCFRCPGPLKVISMKTLR